METLKDARCELIASSRFAQFQAQDGFGTLLARQEPYPGPASGTLEVRAPRAASDRVVTFRLGRRPGRKGPARTAEPRRSRWPRIGGRAFVAPCSFERNRYERSRADMVTCADGHEHALSAPLLTAAPLA